MRSPAGAHEAQLSHQMGVGPAQACPPSQEPQPKTPLTETDRAPVSLFFFSLVRTPTPPALHQNCFSGQTETMVQKAYELSTE